MIVKKLSMILFTFLLAIGLLAACGNDDNKNNNEAANNNAEELDIPEPDLDDIPDVVATVDGEDVTKDDFEMVYTQQFQQQAMYAQMSGEEIDEDELKDQVLDSLIDQAIFFKEAEERFPEVDQDEVDAFIDDLIAQVGVESRDELFDAYEEQGMSEEEVLEEVEMQIRVNQLMDEELEVGDIDEDELKELYDELVEMQEAQNEQAEEPQEIPEFDEIKDQIEANLKQEKEAEELDKLLAKMREGADVETFL